jgi:hypothetical protein
MMWLPPAALLLSLVLALGANATALTAERVDLDVRLDPQSEALYASGKLVLRNTGRTTIEILTLLFPAPLGSRTTCTAVWDADGELGWRSDPAEKPQGRTLSVLLRSRLRPGRKMTLGLNFEITLEGLPPDAPARVSAEDVRLAGAGWYPLPDEADPEPVDRLRLVVRLPKSWQVSAPVKLKKVAESKVLASYELQRERPVRGRTLFRARARPASAPP